MDNVCGRLRNLRNKMQLSQVEFSHKYGINQQTLSKYENGKLSIPDDLKIKLHHEGVNLNWLLTGKGEMFINSVCEHKGEVLSENSELESLKKTISSLEKHCAQLEEDNNQLSSELMDRLRELLQAKDDLLALKGKC